MNNYAMFRTEACYNGRPVLISTVELPGYARKTYETAILYKNMEDVRIWRTCDRMEAYRNHLAAIRFCEATE